MLSTGRCCNAGHVSDDIRLEVELVVLDTRIIRRTISCNSHMISNDPSCESHVIECSSSSLVHRVPTVRVSKTVYSFSKV